MKGRNPFDIILIPLGILIFGSTFVLVLMKKLAVVMVFSGTIASLTGIFGTLISKETTVLALTGVGILILVIGILLWLRNNSFIKALKKELPSFKLG